MIEELDLLFPHIKKEKPYIFDYVFGFHFIELIKAGEEREAIEFGRKYMMNFQRNKLKVNKNTEIIEIELNVFELCFFSLNLF